ncbi:hypothetical protein A8F94_16525 [Bacillus sp. FJAT-27225]|uniref:spore germination protein GerPC n=1 Tax=Bacillus sp. FJAT-27225 TaxID=1743144 RepID=UPI00080C2323|nr:spore germination protein GerPC [Bacillus sp. FJAT-27225]OCA84315.1 hypothetical protein A8F94_16525 [Bacillus sp. FJAT-27225]
MDIYQVLQWMQGQIQAFGQKIATLEESLRCAEEEIRLLKEKPAIQVGTIQYKFDQLKVETLDGTLNIGLNPKDLQGIEEMAIAEGQQGLAGQSGFPGQPGFPGHSDFNSQQPFGLNPGYYPHPIQPVQGMDGLQRNQEIENAIDVYLEEDLPPLIESLKENLGLQKPDDYLSFIKNDVKRQLPARIDSHVRRAEASGQTVDDGIIISSLKKEIENGVRTFLANLPDTMKGGSS